jgi:hypothetical protein
MGKAEVDKLVTRALKQNAVELVVHESELSASDSLTRDIGKSLRAKKSVLLKVILRRPSGVKYEYALYEPWSNKAGVRRSVASFSKRKPVAKKKAPAKIKTKPQIQREYDAKQAKLKKNASVAKSKHSKQAQRLWNAYAKGRPFHARLTFLGTTGKGNQSQKFWEMEGPSVKDGSFLTSWGKIGRAPTEKRASVNVAMKRAEEKLQKGYVIERIF